MSRIVICGATGFIGRNLVEHFARQGGHDIVAVAHLRPPFAEPGVRWAEVDLRDAAAVDRLLEGADIVIQAAATTSGAKDITSKPFIHVTDNAVMNSVLLRAAHEHSVKHFVFFSCTVMYPSSSVPVKEEDFTGEISPKYFGVGWTKVYVEKMCDFYAGLGRTKHTVIRHSNIYGPYDKFDLERSHVFGASVTKAMLAKDELTIWGTGEERRDLLHVDDLVRFVRLAIEKQSANFGLYNCGARAVDLDPRARRADRCGERQEARAQTRPVQAHHPLRSDAQLRQGQSRTRLGAAGCPGGRHRADRRLVAGQYRPACGRLAERLIAGDGSHSRT